ncbi:MAG: hypothetical protein ABI690_02080 [Chloroflexota bacterium]
MADTEMDYTDTFKGALAKPYPLMVLRDALIQLRSYDVEKDVLLAALESFRGQLDEQYEDIVLDAMDLLVGFCSPHMRIE